jgi:hypothetical protein
VVMVVILFLLGCAPFRRVLTAVTEEFAPVLGSDSSAYARSCHDPSNRTPMLSAVLKHPQRCPQSSKRGGRYDFADSGYRDTVVAE